jgi:Tol biopolymer transport system component
VQVTTGPRDWNFSVSTDGRSIAWSSLDPKTKEWGLWIRSTSGGPAKRLTTRNNLLEEVCFTPDGRNILFTGYEHDKLRVYRVPSNGGSVTTVGIAGAHSAAISADGSLVASPIGISDMKHSPLSVVSLSDGKQRTDDLDGMLYNFTPDGKAITYAREENGGVSLLQIPREGGTPKTIANFAEGTIADYAWSPDGKHAALVHVVDSADVVLIR